MFHYRSGLLWLLFSVAAFLILTSSYRTTPAGFHSKDELTAFRNSRALIDSGEYFLGSINCKGCHGFDSLHIANVDESGFDINLYDDWESTMMAFSAIDPFWRAKVSHEILVNPGHADELQTKCTSCHAPMGHYTAMFQGTTSYTMADMLNDTLGLNGVACGACHQIANDTLGLEFSGKIKYDTSHVEYGPFENPVIGPMQLYVGLLPTYSPHVSRSEVCASCHTLQTKVVDLNGNYTGAYFTEQATFHEWKNSAYNNGQPCQSCHMPKINDPVVIANGYLNMAPRSPFNLHQFMGGNSMMIRMIKDNKAALGVDVSDANFDSTLAVTFRLLQQSTLDMQTTIDSIINDSLYVRVELRNKAGHKFPSGYPSRRAFVQFAVTSGVDTIFQSGMLKPDFEVTGQGNSTEPHYDVISDSTQVQIYEMVMGDVNGNFTTVLQRAAIQLKDNRIPPLGFTSTHSTYDTVRIAGAALLDPDFNKNGLSEGTGKDIIHYHIPLRGRYGDVRISAAVYYQVLPPRWLEEMFALNSDFIDSFRMMYQTADKMPVLIAQSEVDTLITPNAINIFTNSEQWKVFPIPSKGGEVMLYHKMQYGMIKLKIYDSAGSLVKDAVYAKSGDAIRIDLPEAAGVYWLRIENGKEIVVKKVVR